MSGCFKSVKETARNLPNDQAQELFKTYRSNFLLNNNSSKIIAQYEYSPFVLESLPAKYDICKVYTDRTREWGCIYIHELDSLKNKDIPLIEYKM